MEPSDYINIDKETYREISQNIGSVGKPVWPDKFYMVSEPVSKDIFEPIPEPTWLDIFQEAATSLSLTSYPSYSQTLLKLPIDIERLKRVIPPIRVKLREDVLTPLDSRLFARKTAEGNIEFFELI